MKFQIQSKFIFFFLLILILGCDTEEEPETPQLPQVATVTNENEVVVSHTSVEIIGSISASENIESYGVVWGTNPSPTVEDNVTMPEGNVAATTGKKKNTKQAENSFTVLITDLTPGVTYYFRTFATNETGTAYGEELTVSPPGLEGTSWEITYHHSEDNSWVGHVDFHEDGTAFYTEPETPGVYDLWGEWAMEGNTLTYDMIPETEDESYILTGELEEHEMSGTYTFNTPEGMTHRPWTAIPLSGVEN